MTLNEQKVVPKVYMKGLNKNDPIDKLIVELVEKGILDVFLIEIRNELPILEAREYSKKLSQQRKRVVSMIPSAKIY